MTNLSLSRNFSHIVMAGTEPGHDDVETDGRNTSIVKCDCPALKGRVRVRPPLVAVLIGFL